MERDMDISAMLLPGAQKVATAMIGDAWTVTRDAIARRWGKGDKKAEDKAATELEVSRTRALALIDGGEPDERLLTAYWLGYLAGVANDHPEWLEALSDVSVQRGELARTAGFVNTGTVEKLVQVEGGVHGGLQM
jgi:hypothetical protein